jgi:hypothetical protein
LADVDQLLNVDPMSLIEGMKTLRDQRVAIESQEAVLKQLLDIQLKKGGQVGEEVAVFAAQNGMGPLREQIRQVLVSKQEEALLMMPMDVHNLLAERGNRSVTLDNVRVTMKRMADDGELVRPDPESVIYGLPNTPTEFLELLKERLEENQSQ